MGFSLELHLLYRHDEDGRGIWHPRETIDFGKVTALEKITDPAFAHIQAEFTGHWRAGICAVSTLFGKMLTKHDATPGEITAPPFLVYEHDRYEALAAVPGDAIDPGMTMDVKIARRPSKLGEHNAFLALDDAARAERLKRYHPVLHVPFLWEDASTLAAWLQEAEDARMDEWIEAERDPLSLALVRSWHFHLQAVGAAAGARALFSFPL